MRRALFALMTVLTPFGAVNAQGQGIGAVRSQQFWIDVDDYATQYVADMSDNLVDYGPFTDRWPGGNFDSAIEVWRQLKSTNPPWSSIMIRRYFAWRRGVGYTWNGLSTHQDVWEYPSPSDFFDEYIQAFGSTNVATGVSEFPFPWGRPAPPPPGDPHRLPPHSPPPGPGPAPSGDPVDDTGDDVPRGNSSSLGLVALLGAVAFLPILIPRSHA